MAELDWHRSLDSAQAQRCTRETAAKRQKAGEGLVSFTRSAFPGFGSRAVRYRVIEDSRRSDGTTVRLCADVVAVVVGRLELTLLVVASANSRDAADGAEHRLVHRMLARART
jgi:hypothetical protein